MVRKSFLLFLVFCWISLIFVMSNQIGTESKEQSLKLVNFVNKNADKLKINVINLGSKDIHYYVRKSGHVLEYFVLTLLFLGLFNTVRFGIKYKYVVSLCFSEVFAILDEYHQTFVTGRDGNLRDVFIDNIGIFLGLIFGFIILHIKIKLIINSENT